MPLIVGFVLLLLLGGGVAAAAFFVLADDEPEAPVVVAEPPDTGVAAPDTSPVDAAAQVVTGDEPEVARVSIQSDPPGASVLIEGAIVGNTPIELRRPEGDASLDVQIRMRDYASQSVRVMSTSDDVITVQLEAEEDERPTMRRTRMRTTMMESTPVMMAEPQMMATHSSDVVDPWANE